MKTRLMLVLALLFLAGCPAASKPAPGDATTPNSSTTPAELTPPNATSAGRASSFAVVITILTHGDHKLMEYRLTDQQLTITQFSTNTAPPKQLQVRALSPKERDTLAVFLANYPLTKLQDRYANDKVEGEIHSEYDLRVGDVRKKLTVYFEKPDQLKRLHQQINPLIATDHRLWE